MVGSYGVIFTNCAKNEGKTTKKYIFTLKNAHFEGKYGETMLNCLPGLRVRYIHSSQ